MFNRSIMPEYIVDCKHLPYGAGKTLPHVRERIIRCRDCRLYDAENGICTYWMVNISMPNPDGFCSLAEPKDGT